jgi:hypothetical protein
MVDRRITMTARYVTSAVLRDLDAQLTDRDQAILRSVCDLRFVTTDQLTRQHFGAGEASARAARRALLRLVRWECLARLPRAVGGARQGSSAFACCLGPAGQRLSVDKGWTAPRRFRPHTPGTLFIRHHLAVAELHTLLVEAERAGQVELLSLEAEPACHRPCGGFTLKPDSYVELGVGEFVDSFFIEVDRGTEGSRALSDQLRRYVRYFDSGLEHQDRGVFPKVLWLVPTPERAAVIQDCIERLPAANRELFEAGEFADALVLMGVQGAGEHLQEHEKIEGRKEVG